MALIAAAIRLTSRSPVFFKQVRAGRGGQPFTMWKFRTMRALQPGQLEGPDDHARTTRLGGLLRRSSLDELPELVNVLRGDMALVGPRPLPIRYVERYSPRQALRLQVKPGITGLAQTSGRNALTWEERFDLDVAYVQRQSLALDLRILGRTLASVLKREGVDANDAVTMTEFRGEGA